MSWPRPLQQKTHIYLEKIEECIREGKNVLFLLPEISLYPIMTSPVNIPSVSWPRPLQQKTHIYLEKIEECIREGK
ncbi:hypothetical protein, partial [Chryseobacterium sp. CH1]|uniref:hypothetical protein n=1 Tax=Chryseobacterium sp. CH1 TaxID=713551 RepID=UPI001E31C943